MTHKQVIFTNRQSSKVDEMKQLVKEHIKKYKGKRFRSAFTTTQIVILEQEYKKNAYLNNTRREELSNKLHLSERTIKIWFQNRRMKEKRENTKTIINCTNVETKLNANNELKNGIIVNSIKIKPLPIDGDVKNSTDKRTIIIEPNRRNNEIKQKNKSRSVEKEIKLYKNTTKNIINRETVKSKSNIIGKVINFNSEEDFCNKAELKNHTITESCSIKTNSESVLQNIKTHVPKNINTGKEFEVNKHTTPKSFPSKKSIKEETPEDDTPVDLSKYYPVIPNQNVPWDPYNIVPVIATGHHLNRPYMVPNTNYASTSTSIFSSNALPNRKCNCNCHNEGFANPSLMNFQPNLPFLYTNYLPHIFGVTNNK